MVRVLTLGGTIGICSLVIAALLVASGPVCAATLTLNDGSVIHGDIKTLQDNVYTVETDTLGTVRVRKQDIRTIDLSDEPASRTPARSSTNGASPGQAELAAMQSLIMQNPDLLAMIEALQSDPDVQAVLSDPEIIRAVAAGDLATLMSHPKIIALTGNAKVREVIKEVP